MSPHMQDYIRVRLAEYQTRHTGKAPFGPVEDLKELYLALGLEDRKEMDAILMSLEKDLFWGDYVGLFRQKYLRNGSLEVWE